MKILIDNGHGENTPGKRSPDGTFREYAYTREISDEVVRELAKRGYVAAASYIRFASSSAFVLPLVV